MVTIPSAGSGYYGTGPVVKYTPINGYRYLVLVGDTQYFLRREDSVGGASVANSGAFAPASGQVVRIEAVTSGANLNITIYVDTVAKVTYTDTAPLTGTRVGFGSYSANTAWVGDDWSGGDYGTVAGLATRKLLLGVGR